jgi:hypothetical protein
MNDVGHALRRAIRRPGLSAVIIVMLAIGIGSTTAMFSLFETFQLRPLPVSDPERLVNLSAPGPKPGSTSIGYAGDLDAVFSYPMLEGRSRCGPERHRAFTVRQRKIAADRGSSSRRLLGHHRRFVAASFRSPHAPLARRASARIR